MTNVSPVSRMRAVLVLLRVWWVRTVDYQPRWPPSRWSLTALGGIVGISAAQWWLHAWYGTVSIGEWVWVGWLGFVVSLHNLCEARRDLFVVRQIRSVGRDGNKLIVARGNARREFFRVLSTLAGLTLGVLLCLAPPRGAGRTAVFPWVGPTINVVQPLAATCILGLGVVANSFLDSRDRRTLIRLFRLVERQSERASRQAKIASQTVQRTQELRQKLANLYQPDTPEG